MDSLSLTRRYFFSRSSLGLGVAALSSLLKAETPFHHTPKAKRVIYLFQSGAPSQLETFDYKPGLKELAGKELPESVRMGQRLTGMTATQTSFPLVPSMFPLPNAANPGRGSAIFSRTPPK